MAHRADGLSDIFEHDVIVRDNIHATGGTIQHTPTNGKDIVNKDYADSLSGTETDPIFNAASAAINAHIASTAIHFTVGSISHTAITNIGTNTHAQIDTHIASSAIHFTQSSIDHTAITNIGTNSHTAIDSHISDSSDPHGTKLTQTNLESSGIASFALVKITGDQSSADTSYVPMVLYNTDATPPTASTFPIGTIYIQYTA